MSNPYGPAIETTEDWNEALACCCQMPAAPAPTMICQSVTVTACGYNLPTHEDMPAADVCLLFKKRAANEDSNFTVSETEEDPPYSYTRTFEQNNFRIFQRAKNGAGACVESLFSGGYSKDDTELAISDGVTTLDTHYFGSTTAGPSGVYSGTESFTDALDAGNNYSGSLATEAVTQDFPDNDWTYASPGSYTQTDTSPGSTTVRTVTFSEPVTLATLNAELAAKIADLDGAAWPDASCVAAAVYVMTPTPCRQPTSITKARYRWRVPNSHLGSYYKITWDVLYEPVGWDDESIPEEDRPLRFSRKNLTVEWTGPGSGAQSDPSWLAGDWFELEVPEEPGIRKVINVRFKHLSEAP